MDRGYVTRRQFLSAASAATAAWATTRPAAPIARNGDAGQLAILGGQPVRTKPFHPWPVWREADEKSVLAVLRKGVWSRDKIVAEAERRFAQLMGARYCLMTTNGTNALITAVRAIGIGAGDEVITTPYTFVASIHPILLANALPVFADIDPDTWQINPARIEAKINQNTVAILPVHIIGGICDMDRINEIARKHNLKVVEDACEAHLGEWKHKKAGTLGNLGCLSFQTAKTLTCGEGGAILGDDEKLMDLCYSFHNLGRPHGKYMSRDKGGHPILATKCRMAEYQASILITQMEAFEAEIQLRCQNADYLTAKLRQIPGIVPRKDYPDTTRTAYYYYGLRYQKEHFNGVSRDRFLAALSAEGIPASKGLGVIEGKPMNKEGLLEDAFSSKAYQRIYSKQKLAGYQKDNECPESDRLCQETVGFHQRVLLGTKADLDGIADAILKIYENREPLSRT